VQLVNSQFSRITTFLDKNTEIGYRNVSIQNTISAVPAVVTPWAKLGALLLALPDPPDIRLTSEYKDIK
jgi:hypothetical protein